MSCGNHHDTDCQSVLDRLYTYLDGEIDAEFHQRIAVHLSECAPCLGEFEIERVVKTLVKRSCADGACTDEIRSRIIARVDDVRSGAPKF